MSPGGDVGIRELSQVLFKSSEFVTVRSMDSGIDCPAIVTGLCARSNGAQELECRIERYR